MSVSENENSTAGFWKNRFRITIQEESTFQERKAFLVSGRRLVAALFGSVGFIVCFVYFIVAHTPLTEYVVPGYMSSEYRKSVGIAKAQSDGALLELEVNARYLDNIKTIIGGGVPSSVDTGLLEVDLIEGVVIPGADSVDLALRERVESEDKYSLNRGGAVSGWGGGVGFQPVVGAISGEFDLTQNHVGVDILAAEGVLVHSVDDGTVVVSDFTAKHGYVIAVQHRNDRLSIYKHNSSLLKVVGNIVKAGDVIATVGNSGTNSSGPHLHFEWWVRGVPTDPSLWLHN